MGLRCFDVGPPSSMVDQHQNNLASASRFSLVRGTCLSIDSCDVVLCLRERRLASSHVVTASVVRANSSAAARQYGKHTYPETRRNV